MSNATQFINAYAGNISNLVSILSTLELQNQQITDDPTLITRYFDNTITPGHRTDIVAADVTAAQNAIVQILFTFNSGSPPQSAALHKMMP